MKFHWKPVAGVHSLVWEEAQIAAGVRPRLPPPRHGRRHRGRRIPGVRARHPGDARRRHRQLRGHRPARPDQARARGTRPGAADRQADAEPQPDQLLRRDRAGRLPHRQPGPRHRGHQRPADAGPAVLLSRHPAHPARRPELHPAADQPAALPGQRHAARRHAPDRRSTPASRPTSRTASTAANHVAGRCRRRRLRADAAPHRGHGGAGAAGLVRRPLLPGRRCSTAA